MRAYALDTVTAFCFGSAPADALSAPGFDAPLGRVMTLIMTFVPSLKHFPVLHWMLNHVPPALVGVLQPELRVFYEFHNVRAISACMLLDWFLRVLIDVLRVPCP